MKPFCWDKQLGLASPLKCVAIQSAKTKSSSKKEIGLDASHCTRVSLEEREKNFFLDILFHRMSQIGMFRQLCRSECFLSSASQAAVSLAGCGRRRRLVQFSFVLDSGVDLGVLEVAVVE